MAKAREYGGRRVVILDSAIELFATRAYEDVSVDDVCKHGGVAHGLVSYHFGGKRGLFAAALEHVARELLEAERPRDDEVTTGQKLRGSLRRRFEYAHNHPGRVALLHARAADPEVHVTLEAVREESMVQWAQSLGASDEWVDEYSPLGLALMAWVGWMDTLMTAVSKADIDIDVVIDLSTQAMIAGIRTASGHHFDEQQEADALDMIMGSTTSNLRAKTEATPRPKTNAAPRRKTT